MLAVTVSRSPYDTIEWTIPTPADTRNGTRQPPAGRDRTLALHAGAWYHQRIMHHRWTSRFVAVLMATLFAGQLLLTGSGVACSMSRTAMERTMMHPMAGSMAMASAASTEHGSVTAPHATAPRQMPCDQRMSWPVCQAMGPCLTALIAPFASSSTGTPCPPERVIAMVVLTPPSQTFPPELPPPRA